LHGHLSLAVNELSGSTHRVLNRHNLTSRITLRSIF
jgi:hypothetical protein